MEIKINISDQANEVLKKCAEASEISYEDYLFRQIRWAERLAKNPEKLEEKIKYIKEAVVKDKADVVYAKYAYKRYELKAGIGIGWRGCPIQDYPTMRAIDREHIGDFHYGISRTKELSGMFRQVEKTEGYYFKSLKCLKKAINGEFEKYGFQKYYKL